MAPTTLVTGATGFVGGATAALLLQCPEAGRLLLLVRETSATAAASRARRSLAVLLPTCPNRPGSVAR